MSERITKLKIFLQQSPDDCFLNHALALEYVKIGDEHQARTLFEKNLQHDPSYIATYYHLGKLLERVGEQVPYSCPECGGGLWELTQPGTLKRYRCHTGHAYTQDSLLLSMSTHLEETLWVAMRTLEERRNILLHMSQGETDKGNQRWAGIQEDRAEEMKVHIERLRELLARTALSDELHIDKAG